MLLKFKNGTYVAYELNADALLNIIKTTPIRTGFYDRVFDLYIDYLSWDPILIQLGYHITNVTNIKDLEDYIKSEVINAYNQIGGKLI